MLNQALEYAKQNQERFLTELNEVLTIPSISTDPAHKADMQYAAEWMSAQLQKIGMSNVQIMPMTSSLPTRSSFGKTRLLSRP
jgi:acetylornithine deacetylase/succinyl-diaminopimelate desuccinylase-like protein